LLTSIILPRVTLKLQLGIGLICIRICRGKPTPKKKGAKNGLLQGKEDRERRR